MVMSPCCGCGNVFSYNPNKVPSTRDSQGVKQPICKECVERVNPKRIANGLEPIVPLPGAYEPVEEYEL